MAFQRIFFLLAFLLPFLAGAQSRSYWNDKARNRKGWFHWDHDARLRYDSSLRVKRVLVYQVWKEGKDSVLESETAFDRAGRARKRTVFAAPSDGGWIGTDSFLYDGDGRETTRFAWELNHRNEIDTTEYRYQWDVAGNLVQQQEITRHRRWTQPGAQLESNEVFTTDYRFEWRPGVETTISDVNGDSASFTTVRFSGRRGKTDSIQQYSGQRWLYTRAFVDDSAARTRSIYRRSGQSRRLEERLRFHPDSTLASVTSKQVWNWTNLRRNTLQVTFRYRPDGLLEQTRYLVGRHRYHKRYHYEFYD